MYPMQVGNEVNYFPPTVPKRQEYEPGFYYSLFQIGAWYPFGPEIIITGEHHTFFWTIYQSVSCTRKAFDLMQFQELAKGSLSKRNICVQYDNDSLKTIIHWK